jgi:transcriptional regulator with XRE-family HTH domain
MDRRPWSCADASTRCCSTWRANRRVLSRRPSCCVRCGATRRTTRRGRWSPTPLGCAASSPTSARPAGCPRPGASATAWRPEHNYQQKEGMENRTELIRFGEQLRRVREQRRLTVVDLAGRSNISPTRVAKLEAGLTDPRFDVLVALSDGLGVGLSAFDPRRRGRAGELAGSEDRQTSRLNSSRLIPAVRRMLPSVPLLIG